MIFSPQNQNVKWLHFAYGHQGSKSFTNEHFQNVSNPIKVYSSSYRNSTTLPTLNRSSPQVSQMQSYFHHTPDYLDCL